MLFEFIASHTTRSGKRYGPLKSIPLACSPEFRLGELLEHALSVETDGVDTDIDDFLQDADGRPTQSDSQSGSRGNDGGIGSWLEKGRLEGGELEEGELEEGEGGEGELEEGELKEGGLKGGSGSDRALSYKQRYRKRLKDAAFELSGQVPRPSDVERCIGRAAERHIDAPLDKLPFSSCGYQGVDAPSSQQRKRIHTFEQLKQLGYTVVKHTPGISQPLVDSNSRKVFGVVVGTVDDPSYSTAVDEAFEFLDETAKGMDIKEKERRHRRGNFAAVNYGVYYGQGSKEPHWLRCSHEETMRRILTNVHMIRIATFASYAFAMWAPNVYEYYRSQANRLAEKLPALKWPFYNTVWQCCTVNFGPHVCCFPHRDALNLPFGWCAITALGRFDHTKGGHLILHDLKLLIEFPPGGLILIPSALLTHGNTPISKGERRMSFTQFSAGGIFRFIDNGFRTEKVLEAEDPAGHAAMMEKKAGRKDFGVGLWSTVEELLQPRTEF